MIKKSEELKHTEFKVEDNFGDVISEGSISPEQITKPNNFFCQIIVNINFSIKINLFKPRKEKIKNYEPCAPPENRIFSN